MGIQEEWEEITEGGTGHGYARLMGVAGQRAGEEKEECVPRGRAEWAVCSWPVRILESLETECMGRSGAPGQLERWPLVRPQRACMPAYGTWLVSMARGNQWSSNCRRDTGELWWEEQAGTRHQTGWRRDWEERCLCWASSPAQGCLPPGLHERNAYFAWQILGLPQMLVVALYKKSCLI